MVKSNGPKVIEMTPKLVIRVAKNLVLKYVNLADTWADGSYQRPPSKKHLNNILANFDIRLARTPMLSERNNGRGGKFAVIDGNHTTKALMKKGHPAHPCLVASGLTVKDEASMFHSINSSSKAVTGWYRFKAALAAGNSVETTIVEISEKYNFILGYLGEPNPDFRTPQVLVRIFRDKGEPVYDRMMATIKAVFCTDGRTQKRAKSTEFLRGLSTFLSSYEEVTPEKFKTAFKKAMPTLIENIGISDEVLLTSEALLQEAQRRAGACAKGRSLDAFVVQVLCEIMNVEPRASFKIKSRLKVKKAA